LRRCLRTIDNFGDWLGEIREFVELRPLGEQIVHGPFALYYGCIVSSINVDMCSFYTIIIYSQSQDTRKMERQLANFAVKD
jgi:hypothetical protein